MGVEPTRDRLTAPPGFEVRTPHRGRFSSKLRLAQSFDFNRTKKVEPVLVDPPHIAVDPDQRRRAVKVAASVLTTDPWEEACQVLPNVNTLTRNAARHGWPCTRPS